MSLTSEDSRLTELVAELELPDGAYEAAKRRYDDLGAWFDRDGCSVAHHDPHIFVQGSFALGTAIIPIGESYDLDLSCKLQAGATRDSHTQEQIKNAVGRELQAYRTARQIDKPLISKHRCWRQAYRDELPFHMDVVPAIAAETSRRQELSALMEASGLDRQLAANAAADAAWITDDRLPNFKAIDRDWYSSNPQGYQQWFLSRMEGAQQALLEKAQVDAVPLYKRKSALQRVIQILKRHRDVMFASKPDAKPISIILTTIAAVEYVRGEGLTQSLRRALDALEAFRVSNSDVVSNPVNPKENFADRWARPECAHLHLKRNFHYWIQQVRNDFNHLLTANSPKLFIEKAAAGWQVSPREDRIGTLMTSVSQASPSPHRVQIQSTAPSPWRR